MTYDKPVFIMASDKLDFANIVSAFIGYCIRKKSLL